MQLTQDEIERYAPYHTVLPFQHGYEDYMAGNRSREPGSDSVGGQAYDRGAECAMRRQMAQYKTKSERTGYDREW